MALSYLIISVLLTSSLLRTASAGFDKTKRDNVAVYWGQNSYGDPTGGLAQQRLSYYCSNTFVDIIPLAFVVAIRDETGQPRLNFANQGNNCTVIYGTNLFACLELENDIGQCQQMYNKTILLSIGGDAFAGGGFSSIAEAETAADLIWATFGPAEEAGTAHRPFGTASVDGFDLDFESRVTNVGPFARRLRTLMDERDAVDGGQRLLTAAPQCPYPDAFDGPFLSSPNSDGHGAVPVDALFVQFYNNYCGLQSFVADASNENFNFHDWDNWAKQVSANSAAKVFLGIPASTRAASTGYKSVDDLQAVISYVKGFDSFGGIMIWEMSQAYANGGYLTAVSSRLKSAR